MQVDTKLPRPRVLYHSSLFFITYNTLACADALATASEWHFNGSTGEKLVGCSAAKEMPSRYGSNGCLSMMTNVHSAVIRHQTVGLYDLERSQALGEILSRYFRHTNIDQVPQDCTGKLWHNNDIFSDTKVGQS